MLRNVGFEVFLVSIGLQRLLVAMRFLIGLTRNHRAVG